MVAALVFSGVAAAGGGSGTLSMTVTPSALAPGGPGVITATFTNTGKTTLTHVVLNVDLAGGTFSSTGSSASCSGTATGATCSLGNLAKGASVVSTIAFTNSSSSGPWTFNGTATWDAASVGNPQGNAANNKATASATAQSIVPTGSSLLVVNSGCAANGGSVAATNGDEGISATAGTPPDSLPCTPITDGVVTDPNGGSDILFVKLPATPNPVSVTLTFADDNLPHPGTEVGDGPANLTEYPNFPDLSTSVTVPFCNLESSTPIPAGSDSCIVSVNPADDNDDDGFSDVGTIDLLVQSNGNDPGYH
jgi:hypothetical protein